MLRLIPRPIHRNALKVAYVVRHRWRVWRKVELQGVSAILRDHHDRVLLVRHSYGSGAWAVPGGGCKQGEDPADAVRREIHEEVSCTITRLQCIGIIEEQLSGSPHRAHVFTGLVDDVPRPDGREIVEARFFPAHSLPEPLSVLTRRRLDFWRANMRAGT